MNRVGENLERGGVSDWHKDRRGKLRSVRALRGIDSKVSLNSYISVLLDLFKIRYYLWTGKYK